MGYTRLEIENRIAKLSVNMEKNARLVAKGQRIQKKVTDREDPPMNTEALMEVVKNRLDINKQDENNPTTHSFLYELYKALEKLKRYEDVGKDNARSDPDEDL